LVAVGVRCSSLVDCQPVSQPPIQPPTPHELTCQDAQDLTHAHRGRGGAGCSATASAEATGADLVGWWVGGLVVGLVGVFGWLVGWLVETTACQSVTRPPSISSHLRVAARLPEPQQRQQQLLLLAVGQHPVKNGVRRAAATRSRPAPAARSRPAAASTATARSGSSGGSGGGGAA
jgi:hypothetical protein